jgi:hypothetical protein
MFKVSNSENQVEKSRNGHETSMRRVGEPLAEPKLHSHGNQALLRRSRNGATPPQLPLRPSQSILLQRKCACGSPTSSLLEANSRRTSKGVIQRQPMTNELGRERQILPQQGNTLPYREATELLDCIKIMGEQNAASCRQQVLGEEAPGEQVTPNAPGKGCKYTVAYANPKEVDCDKVWREEKGTPPPGPLCGKRVIYEIVSVSASDSSCPLAGLEVSEHVETVPDTHRCTPPNFKWPAPRPCKIGPGGKLTGCTDTLTICGPTSDLHYGGCEENITQDILVDNKPIEKHTITFELDVQGANCTSTINRK